MYKQIYICTLSQHYDRNLVCWKYCTSHHPIPVGYLIWYPAKSGSGRIPKKWNPVHP